MDVSFTARLSNIMTLSSAILDTNAGLDRIATQAQAKVLEEQIYSQATSKEKYEAACQREIESLGRESQAAQKELKELEEEVLDPNAPDLGPYEKATFYKHGLFSTIFKAATKARDDGDGGAVSRVVALKVTTPSAMTAPHNSKREVMILHEARCDHVIPLLSTLWQSGGRLVLVFPFMPVSLDALMQKSSLHQAQAKSVIRDLLNALTHLHSLDIIHRDVKPANILLQSPNGRAYIADFGIAWSPARSASEPAQQKITDVGTTSYRPPELLFGYAAYGTSLDLWAAGCTVAEMVRPNHRSLFDAGDLGSELALIKSIFSTLGTPDEELWPVGIYKKRAASVLPADDKSSQSVKQFPDWGKMRFVQYPAKPWVTILDESCSLVVDFVSSLVQYEGSRRMTAAQALNHAFLKDAQ